MDAFSCPTISSKRTRNEDIFLTSQEGLINTERTYYKAAYANYRNANVRSMFLDFVGRLAKHYRNDDRFLFYVLGWEDYWTLRVDGKTRMRGYSPPAKAMFRELP